MRSSRGQAYVETAIMLPLFLLLLYGLIWLLQVSVLNERGQIAVRYSGLVSNESAPYDGWSLYAIYNNVGSNTYSYLSSCTAPVVDAYINGTTNGFPGPQAAPFWQPDNNNLASTSCSASRVKVSGSQLTTQQLLLHTDASSSVTKTAPGYVQPALGGSGSTTVSAELNFFNTPDMTAMMQCYKELHDDISASLQGETAPSSSPTIPGAIYGGTTPTTPAVSITC
jgi:hypothetical protein